MHPSRPSSISGENCVFSLPVRVYYEDTDAAGVIYYANYLRYCERARTEWLRAAGFEQQALLTEQRIGFVVRSVTGDYLSAGMLDDALHVTAGVEALRGASLVFVQKVMRGDEVLFRGRFIIACVDLDRKRPTPLPADMRIKLEKIVQA
ncbi:tol-pal system-associated acyl-CoA thioesterase [Aromatoleum toluclasticum]|uniref:tol-pal system-associated acyl-CoA thioesterase n=1 Tax=Aromatoleum toluclasticum TaxID=92003 RepID=UPI0003A56289|nr:tol-pal system-associated acyl-CoA thioesterase [Aromatoleum toluclasticum]